MVNLYLKWTALVWLNAIVGLILGMADRGTAHNVGVCLGICVFIPIYALLENYAIKTGNLKLQKSLLIGVTIRACLQLIVVVDMGAGILAHTIVNALFGFGIDSRGFLSGFLLTITTGAILSLVAGVLVTLTMLFLQIFEKPTSSENTLPQN